MKLQNELHKEKVKAYSKKEYQQNQLHRQRVQALSRSQYHENLQHKENVTASNKLKKLQGKRKDHAF